MAYVQGFVQPVPTANRQAYVDHATRVVPLIREFGATRLVEAWGDDVPDGTVTDFRRAVKAEEGETVVFSWLEWPDRPTYDAGTARMMEDPRMAELGDMPFDGRRMIYGGFDPLLDVGAAGAGDYVDGYLAPVQPGNRDAYRRLAQQAAAVFLDHGATRVVEAWGEYLPDGHTTDFRRAVAAEAGEAVVFSWIEWPSREARDAGWAKTMADERMKTRPADMPFDGKRMVYGGFAPVLDA